MYLHLGRKRQAILAIIDKKRLDVKIEWIPRGKVRQTPISEIGMT